MTQREAWMVAVLCVVTCGVYGMYKVAQALGAPVPAAG